MVLLLFAHASNKRTINVTEYMMSQKIMQIIFVCLTHNQNPPWLQLRVFRCFFFSFFSFFFFCENMTWVLIRSTSMTKCVLIIYAFVEKNKYNFLVKLSLKCLELFFFENIFETQINSLTSLGPLRHNCMNQSEPFMLLKFSLFLTFMQSILFKDLTELFKA